MKKKHFLAAMYLRLSRDDGDVGNITGGDGMVKSESNSISSQRELIRAYIQEQQDIELYDIYVDDGFSGSNFERPELKRMIEDIDAGKVNCVIVKDLSRFGRDYIESGRYIQKSFPALGVRFIALTDHYDSFSADAGESNIILPVKNFINDSYCRDISMKVKSQFEVKRKNGENVSPFTVYGYKKDEENKNKLIVDPYAAENVKKIFEWKLEGLAITAIAARLNKLGILSPKEYKKSTGNYRGGFSGKERSLWRFSTVKRILTDEIYLGHLLQGKTEKVNYKVKKQIDKPKEEWIKVEDTHEAIIQFDTFEIVQNLLKADGRLSSVIEKNSGHMSSHLSGDYHLFTGLLFCGDCKEQMIRRVNRYKDKVKVYYICSTKNRGDGCSRHSIEEESLTAMLIDIVRCYANSFLDKAALFKKVIKLETNFESIVRYDTEIERLKQEQDKYYMLYSGLNTDLREGVISKDEFERLYGKFKRKADDFAEAQKKQENFIKELFKNGVLSAGRLKAFKDCIELREIDRHTIRSLIKQIDVYENRRIEVEFYFMDQYRIVQDINHGWKEEQKRSIKQKEEIIEWAG